MLRVNLDNYNFIFPAYRLQKVELDKRKKHPLYKKRISYKMKYSYIDGPGVSMPTFVTSSVESNIVYYGYTVVIL